MTNEQINIAIARACGWTDIRLPSDESYHAIDTVILDYLQGRVAGVKPACSSHFVIPDYVNDLDAMHEAENTLDSHQRLLCYSNLVSLLDKNPDGTYRYGACVYWETYHATARQRAEAFLRTLNLWFD